ncbi:AraC family transcriptional regulator [Oscillospiraceae bacterium PP1C4]
MKKTEDQISNNPIGIYYQENNDYCDMSRHFHHLYEIILITEGSAEFIINSKHYVARKNSLIFISDLENHAVKVAQYPYKRYVITMTRDFTLMMIKDPTLMSVLVQRPESFPYIAELNETLTTKMVHLLSDLLDECRICDAFWLNRSAAIITGLLIDLYRHNKKVFPINENTNIVQTVLSIQRYISKNFSNEITLDELSAQYFISKYYLSRSFKEISGYNFKDYIILHRLTEAKEMLCHTNRLVTDIGASVGYSNVNHFIRIFKQHEGISPLQYRKLHLDHHLKNEGHFL